MILDDFRLHTLVLQISYRSGFEIWDTAGHMARELDEIWGGLRLTDASPKSQNLKGADVVISTGFEHSSVSVLRDRTKPSVVVPLLASTFDVWRRGLSLKKLSRISARSLYVKEFPDLSSANKFIFELGAVRWPEGKVFNIEEDASANGPEIAFRFQDEATFSVVRVKAEQLEFTADLDKDYVQDIIKVEKNRVLLDFDRGNTGDIDAEKLRIDEWFKGYTHVMRRDLPKVLGE